MVEKTQQGDLLLVLGDQLTINSELLHSAHKDVDTVWMAEVVGESEAVWSTKQRTALFLASMRNFASELSKNDFRLQYQKLGDKGAAKTFAGALSETLSTQSYRRVRVVQPGEYRVQKALENTCQDVGIPLEVLEDRHFLSTPDEFAQHTSGRKQLRMEYFYREMRRKHDVLMDGKQPAGGKWNFDASNRQPFGKKGPPSPRPRYRAEPNATTRQVLQEVESCFATHPGSLDSFGWPTTRREALKALDDFIEFELPNFGAHQDAMWTGEPFLSHSLISSSLNLKLLDPREVIDAAETTYRNGRVSIESVEGFIRQILGWREYVRGIYWLHMPNYVERNALNARQNLPTFYWNGNTEMRCLHETITQTLEFGYAHHIQRLMVLGLYTLLLGVRPEEVHKWFLAVYVDAVEWVELPNTLGMSQYADGGVMASKPYAATGKYIKRMSNYCQSCRFDPGTRTGPRACPFTTLYWDFLDRNKAKLKSNPRMSMQLRNLANIPEAELKQIRATAEDIQKTGQPNSEQTHEQTSLVGI